MESMSPGWVDSSSTPMDGAVALDRHGDGDDHLAAVVDAHELGDVPLRAAIDLG